MDTAPSTRITRACQAASRWIIASVLLCATGARAAESVATAWVQRYSHPTTSPGGATDVVTDHAGNAIVAGAAHNGVTGGDFLIIKYSGAGVPLWTNRYDGPGSLDDGAAAVAVDAEDNVFVTGICCARRWENGDYATIKYSGEGVALWTNCYSGPGDSDDRPRAIAVDSSGNVFVTGFSTGAGSSYDYATVGYSSAGVPLWTNRYNGPGNGYDDAFALAVDNSGNVFVTGASAAIGGSSDFSTVAYSNAGVPLWTNRFSDGIPAAIAVDGNGNVFVTGDACSTPACGAGDIATVAYSGAGVPLWTNRYNGPANGYDGAQALAVDSSGNVLVVGVSGSSGVTIKYSGAGVTLWTEYWGASSPTAVAVNSDGNIFVTGSTFVTVAYSVAGALIWTNSFSEMGNRDDTSYALAVDGSGNVFVTGASDPTSSGVSTTDYATVAYSSTGVPLWTNRYNGTQNAGDYATAIAVDKGGNVMITGTSESDYLTIKYSGAGVPLWTNRSTGGGSGRNYARGIVVDASGGVFLTGSSPAINGYDDYATVAYSSAGAPLWSHRYNGPANGNDRASDVAVDSGGNVFVTGSSVGVGSAEDYLTIKYSAAGALLWSNRYAGPGNKTDIAAAMAVDNHDNVIVTGFSVGTSGYYDYTTVAYSGAGVPLWTNRFPGSTGAYWPAMAVDSNRNVFVTGTSGDWPAFELVTIKYSEAGAASWTNRHEGSAAAIAVDVRGNVFVAGYASRPDDSLDSITVKYSGAGVPLWTNSYRGPGGGTFPRSKSSLAIGPDGAAFVTGWSASGSLYDSGFDFATIKLVSVPALEIRRSSAEVILSWPSSFSDFSLQQNTSPTSTGWSNFGGPVRDDGTNRTVTVGPPTGSQFYRLFKL